MVARNGLFRIFWPSDALSDSNQGVLIGWRNSEHDVVVTAILRDVEVSFVHRLCPAFRSRVHSPEALTMHCALELFSAKVRIQSSGSSITAGNRRCRSLE